MKYNIKKPEIKYLRLDDPYVSFASVIRRKEDYDNDSAIYMLARYGDLITYEDGKLVVIHLGTADIQLWPNETLVEVIEEA